MKPMNQRLHDFWFESAPATRLALLRIMLGLFSIGYLVPELDDFVKVAKSDPRLFVPVGVVFGDPIGIELIHWLLRGTLVAAGFFTLGLWYRITGPAFAGLALWLFCYRNSWSMIYHSDNLVVLHAIVLAFTRSADALSLDALFRDRRQGSASAADRVSWRYGWPVRLMCAVTVCTYFVTAVAKLSGALGLEWMTGQALRSQMAVDQIRKELLGADPNAVSYALYDWLPLFTVLAIGSLATEFFAPVALLNRRIGRIWAVNTFLMHWGILLVMHITFHYQLWGLITPMFASFFRVERLLELPRKLWRRWRRRATEDVQEILPEASPGLAAKPGLPRATLYYDGECGLCDRFIQFVLRHDDHEYFQFATLQSDAGRAQLRQLGLPETELKTVVLAEAGKSYERSSATLRVCRRLGGLWPLLYGFIVIPKRWRDAAYSLVARNRKRWFKASPSCAVMSPQWRRRFIS
jgi:predicted DCC family thiol-disulfide oxidoreductase YuxK